MQQKKKNQQRLQNKKHFIVSVFLILATLMGGHNGVVAQQKTKQAHLSNAWYKSDAKELNLNIDAYLSYTKKHFRVSANKDKIKALIVPHAGYYYSGYCAAASYNTLVDIKNGKPLLNKKIKKVIVIAPSHYQHFEGVALPDFDTYQTPLGQIKVDLNSVNALKKSTGFSVQKEVYNKEHSLEIQLPFLQKTIANFKLVPLIVGQVNTNDYAKLAAKINAIIDENTLVVISSDFTHHGENYSYSPFKKNISDQLKRLDSRALQSITNNSFEEFNTYIKKSKATVCGRNPIQLFLKMKELSALSKTTPRLACYYTSAHLTQANKDKKIIKQELLGSLADVAVKNSVSYMAVVYSTEKISSLPQKQQMTAYERLALIIEAREALANLFAQKRKADSLIWPIISPGIAGNQGSFVTLNTKNHDLRGCIGRITTNKPLYQTIVEMTRSAALYDNRFERVNQEESIQLSMSISVLSPPKKVNSYNDIVVGKHGIIIKKKVKNYTHSAVYLPQVATEQGWDLTTTLNYLSRKAGLATDGWKSNCSFEVFEGFEIKESGYQH